MEQIFHLFNSNASHLVLNITQNIIDNFDNNKHYFILIGDDLDKWKLYEDKWIDSAYTNFIFFKSIYHFITKRKNILCKDSVLLMHGGNYPLMIALLTLGYKHINWICWGSGCTINNNWKSRLSSIVKKKLYRHFDAIVTLMKPDKNSLIQDFKLNNVVDIPYIGNGKKISKEYLVQSPSREKRLVYLGNNPYSINSYIVLLDRLLPYKSMVDILCMVNYALEQVDSSLYNELKEKGYKLWGDSFYADTHLYDIKDYYSYMNKCDVYICGVDTQTGLGAIYACLQLGKKIFLRGKNYEYISGLGCIIFHCDELTNHYNPSLLLTPLSYEDKINNYNIIIALLDQPKIKKKWTEFYEYISDMK